MKRERKARTCFCVSRTRESLKKEIEDSEDEKGRVTMGPEEPREVERSRYSATGTYVGTREILRYGIQEPAMDASYSAPRVSAYRRTDKARFCHRE